ncbi:SulP family sulfate permease [Enterovirga rhinocerotis]|uniref:SulP family sulfate permease n=2 Tax=Enterovirga rhinocerotis TaxID=1339210 RepID=A0A4R7C972_9HYPH|nr:SulP family sulfate permease [Enterovirga rhinocerotis]
MLREIGAGATVALLTLPFAVSAGVLAYAPLGRDYIAAGAATGILCAVSGGIVGALTRSSSFIGNVPSAPLALIQASFVSALLAGFGGDPAIALALMPLSVILAGFWQALFGWSGFVRIVKFTPYPVLAGFVTGLSVRTFVQQFPRLFELPTPSAFWDAVVAGTVPHLPMAAFGLVVVAVIRLSDHFAPRFPAMLVGLVTGSLAWHALMALWPSLEIGRTVGAMSLAEATIGFSLRWDLFARIFEDAALVQNVVLTSLTLAAVSMLDFTFSVRTAQSVSDVRLSPPRDLAGQGLANVASALTGGIAVTSSLGTTLAVFEAGGRTRIATLSLAVFLLIAAIVGPHLIGAMPIIVLTAMLISIAWKMWDRWCFAVSRDALVAANPEVRTRARRNLAIVVAVMAATVLGQPILGAVVGVILSCLVFIMEMGRPIVRRQLDCSRISSKRIRSQQDRAVLAAQGGRTVVFDLQGVLFFGNADDLATAIQNLHGRVRTLILDFHRVTDLDTSGATVLRQIARRTAENGVQLVLAGPAPKYRPLLEEALSEAPGVRLFPDLDAALEEAEDRVLAAHGPGPGWAGLAIHETDLGGGLSEAELKALVGRLEHASYAAGEALCRAGEPADRLWIITRGSVSIRVAGAHHARRIAALGPGTAVGEMGLLDRRPRSADVVADEDVESYVLTAEHFDALLRDEARLGQSLLATIARLTAQRLRDTSEELRLADV